MGVVKFTLCLTTLADSLIPLSHLNESVGMIQTLTMTLTDTCSVPSKWRDCLACRECKRALILYLDQSVKHFAVVHVGLENTKKSF